MQRDAKTPRHCSSYTLRPFSHLVACRCGMLLGVVAQSLKPVGQTFEATTPNISFIPWSPKVSATMLDLFVQLLPHYCWVSKVLWDVSFPRCTVGFNIVGSCCSICCSHLHTTAKTDPDSQHCWINNVGSCSLRPFARNFTIENFELAIKFRGKI